MVDRRIPNAIIIGGIIGFLLSLVLYFTQEFEPFFYLTAAPLHLDHLTFNSEGLVSVITFAYFILIFAALGYLIVAKLPRTRQITFIVLIIALHVCLAYSGARTVTAGMLAALHTFSLPTH